MCSDWEPGPLNILFKKLILIKKMIARLIVWKIIIWGSSTTRAHSQFNIRLWQLKDKIRHWVALRPIQCTVVLISVHNMYDNDYEASRVLWPLHKNLLQWAIHGAIPLLHYMVFSIQQILYIQRPPIAAIFIWTASLLLTQTQAIQTERAAIHCHNQPETPSLS